MSNPLPRRAILLGALASASLGAGPASAYVRTRTAESAPMRWDHACVPLNVYVADPPAPLTRAQVLAAAKGAAGAWSATTLACSSLQLQVPAAALAAASTWARVSGAGGSAT